MKCYLASLERLVELIKGRQTTESMRKKLTKAAKCAITMKSTWKCITLAYKFNMLSHKVIIIPCVRMRVRLLGGTGLQDYLAQNLSKMPSIHASLPQSYTPRSVPTSPPRSS